MLQKLCEATGLRQQVDEAQSSTPVHALAGTHQPSPVISSVHITDYRTGQHIVGTRCPGQHQYSYHQVDEA